MKKRWIALLSMLALVLVFATACQSGEQGSAEGDSKWAKEVQLYVPAKAGGGTDVMARTIAKEINTKHGHNVTIVNNTDGGGVISFEKVRNSKPDGKELLYYHTAILIREATGVYDKSVTDDFKVIMVAPGEEAVTQVLLVSGDSKFETLDDVIKEAKANPGKLLLGVETGGNSHVIGGMFASAADIDIQYVEAGSDTEKLTALVGHNVDMVLVNPNQAKQYLEAGKAKALAAVSGTEDGRSTVLPDVKNFVEQGVDFTYALYNVVLGPKEMSDDLAKEIYTTISTSATSEEVNKVLRPAGLSMTPFSYEEGQEKLKAQSEAIKAVVEKLGLKKN